MMRAFLVSFIKAHPLWTVVILLVLAVMTFLGSSLPDDQSFWVGFFVGVVVLFGFVIFWVLSRSKPNGDLPSEK